MRAYNPVNNWDWNELLLNRIAYFVEVLVWQQTKEGQKKHSSKQPKMYTPPFMEKSAETNKENEVHTTDDIKAILAKPRQQG